jgi:hypothetical protein
MQQLLQVQTYAIETEWIKYDLLIYSPSISSGVSFVAKHFDCLVAYFVNSVWTLA